MWGSRTTRRALECRQCGKNERIKTFAELGAAEELALAQTAEGGAGGDQGAPKKSQLGLCNWGTGNHRRSLVGHKDPS